MLADKCLAVLEDGDHRMLRRAWSEVFPHLPGPKTDADAEIVLHHARTQDRRVTFSKRAYSHRWLTERNLPSGLPDALRPRAERMYPKVVEAVGIAVRSKYPEVVERVRGAMERVVLDCYAEGRKDPAFVKSRMLAARDDETKRLFGSLVARA